MLPRPTLEEFDVHLQDAGLRLEATVIGGAALVLLGLTDRQTRDVDILQPELSTEVSETARVFAGRLRGRGIDLADDWLNNGPLQLAEVLPAGWRIRLQSAFVGEALILTTLGRADLLKSKLFALCDRGTDLGDCLALTPSTHELDSALPWLVEQDGNPLWPDHVRETLDELRRWSRNAHR